VRRSGRGPQIGHRRAQSRANAPMLRMAVRAFPGPAVEARGVDARPVIGDRRAAGSSGDGASGGPTVAEPARASSVSKRGGGAVRGRPAEASVGGGTAGAASSGGIETPRGAAGFAGAHTLRRLADAEDRGDELRRTLQADRTRDLRAPPQTGAAREPTGPASRFELRVGEHDAVEDDRRAVRTRSAARRPGGRVVASLLVARRLSPLHQDSWWRAARCAAAVGRSAAGQGLSTRAASTYNDARCIYGRVPGRSCDWIVASVVGRDLACPVCAVRSRT